MTKSEMATVFFFQAEGYDFRTTVYYLTAWYDAFIPGASWRWLLLGVSSVMCEASSRL
uniref:Uncharacterized protein n=1 Tax=Aegilops tauschii subsp. strangulata TaxID=200361 RepID=A0A453H073_AEGTS